MANAEVEDSQAQDAGAAFMDSIKAITRHIGKVVIKTVEEDYINPFQERMDSKIEEIKAIQKSNEELFQSNVMDAVKKSRREIVEDRLAQFNVADLIEKLTTIPEQISAAQTNLRSLRQSVNDSKIQYEVELQQLVTVAAQQGMIGSNAEDRDAIIKLIEDRIKNTATHGTVVSLVLQSTGRDKALLECSNLDVSRAEKLYSALQINVRALEDTEVENAKLDNQFKALRQVASLISSVSS